MKRIYIACCLLLVACSAIQAQTDPGKDVALKISLKMKDSLSLTTTQQQQLYLVNKQLVYQKNALWAQYTNSDSLQVHVQQVENTRDTLYHMILPGDKYLLYQQKKKNLVNNN